MMITDVIREAETEHEIYFLLTAYVEAVRYLDKFNFLPRYMRDLPFAGMDSVKVRVEGLRAGLGESDILNRPLLKEAMDIFAAALDRLGSLEQERPPQAA
jgi:hypothetical protein